MCLRLLRIQLLQEGIQHYVQVRSPLETMRWSVPLASFLFISVPSQTNADACCDVWVGEVSSDEEEGDANHFDQKNVGACAMNPAPQVHQSVEIMETVSIKEVLHELLNNMSSKKPVRVNTRRRHTCTLYFLFAFCIFLFAFSLILICIYFFLFAFFCLCLSLLGHRRCASRDLTNSKPLFKQ